MTTVNQDEIDQLFAEALDLEPAAQDVFLLKRCTGQPALYQQVKALLEADREAELVLGDSAEDIAATFLDDLSLDAEQPERIGRYRVVRELGRGGMGAVYLAERDDDQFKRLVAVKLIRSGLDMGELRRRFRYERQILASLEHPHIARLYDAGISETGHPYLVMEYVEGQALDVYCNEQRLDIDQRLALFETVCEAVQHAHRNLVVHRDIKPSNILVSDNGDVKLLDFGIAKLLDDPDTSEQTQTELRLLTPEYASPEQIEGGPINTATDVYGLGVVLYELLTGHRPYSFEGRKGLMAAQVVLSEEPARPSTMVKRTRHHSDGSVTRLSPELICAVRQTTVPRLHRRLQGDLDTILLTTLRKDASRRYPSAERLLHDLRHHRSGRPISAREDTIGYRIQKFIGRHTVGVAMFCAVVGLTIGFIALLLRQQTATRQALVQAEQVALVLEEIFSSSDPFTQNPAAADSIKVLDLLSNGILKVQTDLRDQPAVQAQMLHKLGVVYQRIGLLEQALPLLEQALSLRTQLFGTPHPSVAESMTTMAELRGALGFYAEAVSMLEAALEIGQIVKDPIPVQALRINRLAVNWRELGSLEKADSLHREAISRFERNAGSHLEARIEVMNSLASTLERKGDYDEAEPVAQAALELQRSLYGAGHPNLIFGLNEMALLLQRKGDYESAESLIRESLGISTHSLGLTHPFIARDYHRLASILYWKGQLDSAETYHRASLKIKQNLYNTDHLDIADGLSDLATVMREMGKLEEAESLSRESLAMVRRLVGDDHPDVAISMGNLAPTLLLMGRYEEAEQMFREALDRIQTHLPDDELRIAALMRWHGRCLTALHRYQEAEVVLTYSYETLMTMRGAADPIVQDARIQLMALYEATGNTEKAAAYR